MILSGGSTVTTPTQLALLSDTTPMFANAQYYAHTDLQLAGVRAAYGLLYRQQLWVGVVVRKLAMLTARIPFDVKSQKSDNEMRPTPGPLADLLKSPNATLSGFNLWRWTSATQSIYGEAFWLKIRDNSGRVRELHPMHPANTVVRRGDDGLLEYVYMTGGTYATSLPAYPATDIVAFTNYNPDTLNRGISNLESLRATLLNEDASRRAQSSFWQKGARPSVVLTHPQTLSDGARQRIKNDMQASHQGADNFGSVPILEEGLVPTVLQLTSEDMQYIEGRKLNREEVAAAYDIPPPAVHILDHATYSNITEQLRSVYRDTMAPVFESFEAAVDHQLVPDFYPASANVFTRFNMDEVLRGDFETRASAVGGLIQKGVITPNEARPMFGQAPYADPVADKLYADATLVPLGSPAERISITAAEPTTPSQSQEVQEVAGSADAVAVDSPIKGVTVRGVMGEVGRKVGKREQRAALIAEHEKALKSFFDKQGAATTKAFNPEDWDGDLAALLSTLGTATAQVVGRAVAKSMGGSYSLEDLADWLDNDTNIAAAKINQTTADQIKNIIANAEDSNLPTTPAVTGFFASQMQSRAAQIAATRVAIVGGFASHDAAKQNKANTKTWVTGYKPRSSHADMDGETVGIDELFSNGMNGPGDPAGGADEVAGCNCSLEFNTEAS